MIDPVLQLVMNLAIGLLAFLGVGFFNPYNTFRLQSKHGKLEKNIALRDSLPEGSRSKELDYVIERQAREYSLDVLRKERKPRRWFRVLFYIGNFLWILPLATTLIYLISDKKSVILSGGSFVILVVMFVAGIALRSIVGNKAKEIELNYGYYGAYLTSGSNGRKNITDTPVDIILRLPKYSIAEKGDSKEIVTHDKVYVYNKGNGTIYIYSLERNYSPFAANAKITLGNHTITENDILIFSYRFEGTILSDDLLKENKKVFMIPYNDNFYSELELEIPNRVLKILQIFKGKILVQEVLYFRNIFGINLKGVQRRGKNLSWWEQIKEGDPDHEEQIMHTNGYPNFR